MRRILYIVLVITVASCGIMQRESATVKPGRVSFDARYEYYLGEALRQKYVGEMSQAVALLEKCIQFDNSRALPYYELSHIYFDAGMRARALEYASRAARIEPDNYWYQLASGTLYAQSERQDSAIVYFERALRVKPHETSVLAFLTNLYVEEGNFIKSDSLLAIADREGFVTDELSMLYIARSMERREYENAERKTLRLLEENPDDVRLRSILADIFYKAGYGSKSDSIYSKIIAENPEDIEAQIYYLSGLVMKGDWSQVTGLLNTLFAFKEFPLDRKLQVARIVSQDSLFLTANFDPFMESLNILEENYPDEGMVFVVRPVAYQTVGRDGEATEIFENLMRKGFTEFFIREMLISLYVDAADYQKLYNLTATYSRENNRSFAAKIYYALSAMQLGEYEVADAEFKKALILAGNTEEVRASVLASYGDLKYRMKDVDGAIKLYEEAYQLNSGDYVLLNNYAYFLAEADRDLKLALGMIEKVIADLDENNTYSDTYAWVLYKLGRVRAAHKVMLRIFDNGQEVSADHYEHMGYIKRSLRKCNEAILFWQKALNEDDTKTYLTEEIRRCTK